MGVEILGTTMTGDNYKFQKLKVYQLALQFLDNIYAIKIKLPEFEKYNLASQMIRAATSVVLNIAEGSTGQSNIEQARFLSISLRSYLETIACFDICLLRKYVSRKELQKSYEIGHKLFIALNAMRNKLLPKGYKVGEEDVWYLEEEE